MEHLLVTPMPIEAANIVVEMRVRRVFGWTVRADRLLSRVGLGLPHRFVAWVAGRSVQARVRGRWQTVVVPTDEVIANAIG